MAKIKSFPNNQDEYIGAEDVMRWLHGRTSGVFGADENAAVRRVYGTMQVTVSDGIGWLANDNGDGIVWWINEEANTGSKLTLTCDMADATLPRIDRVVVSWQTTNYAALPEVSILKGTPASNPVAPALTNDATLRQISLAAIQIPAGSTEITNPRVTDERLDASVCGLVTAGIGIDTSMIQTQWTGVYEQFVREIEEQRAIWDSFFDKVQKDILVPVPTTSDRNKVLAVNNAGDGFELKETRGTYVSQIPANTWAGTEPPYTHAITISGITGLNETVHVSPVYNGTLEAKIKQKEAWAMVSDADTSIDTITFSCFESKPEVALTVQIEVIR